MVKIHAIKMYILKPNPSLLRRMKDLSALGNPEDAPKWLTPQYIAKCMENNKIQKNWEPRTGDWYLCTDLFKVMKIDTIEKYLSEGQLNIPADSPIGSIARGGCDVYIPNPKTLERILKK